jgi:hypothetical protein
MMYISLFRISPTGHGGSYSLLWNQWGHTFYDYLHADKRMTEPQATLRSLGIIKSSGVNYLNSASMRMANEESGMNPGDLDDFVEAGGFFFLPASWQQSIKEVSDISEYHAFVLGTLKRTERHLEKINVFAVVAYLLFAILLRRQSTICSSISTSLFRVVVICGLVLVLSWRAVRQVENSNWAKGIRSGKAYTLPWVEIDEPRPSTLPHRSDVLFVPHYASNYMASYSHVIDVAHPGNKFWNDLVSEMAKGYMDLSPTLQQLFCEMLLESITAQRRFLEQGVDRLWYNVTSHDQLRKFCHTEFVKSSNPLKNALLFEIDALKSESEFGMFRMTGMHMTQTNGLLEQWEKRILLPFEGTRDAKSSVVRNNVSTKTTATLRPRTSLPTIPPKASHKRQTTALPPKPTPKPPTLNAWLQVGDRVKVLSGCKANGKKTS